MKIQMVDLNNQYLKIKKELDEAITNVINNSNFINGPEVIKFKNDFSNYLGGSKVITCANGTDALQVALMSLDLKPGDEVIVPSFTYAATAEVICLLNLIPVLVDVDLDTFNISTEKIIKAISSKTKVIIPVHLFGQCADMEKIMEIAIEYGIYVIEDAAQAIGSTIKFKNENLQAGTIGHIGCTSFFPTKNLGCYGDGGAIITKNDDLANKIEMICNHGQSSKYNHKIIGVNSRLDSLQAAVLNVKLKYFDLYISNRISSANLYNSLLNNLETISLPVRNSNSKHVFHQYTIKVKNGLREKLQDNLKKEGVPTMVYYPLPLYRQDAFKSIVKVNGSQKNTELLCNEVLSLPMHSELDIEQQMHISNCIFNFFNN